MSKGKIILTILSIIFFTNAYSQKGFIAGTVTSTEGDTLSYAKVFIDSTTYYNYSKKNGYYLLKNVNPGVYTVSAYSANRELSVDLPNIEVKAGDTTFLNLGLSVKTIKVSGSILTFKSQVKDNAVAVDEEIKNSDVATSAIGSKEVSKVSNVTAAATKITGVSVVGGKYVYIRGLSDRYSKTILNQAEIPGLDPNRNSVQLDMFPTAFISSMVVVKTYSPEYPADWAGGILDIRTKEYPESDSLEIDLKLGLSYNTMGSFQKDFLTYQGGKMDFLGMDDGSRQLPSYMQGLVDNNQLYLMDKATSQASKEVYTNAIRSFNKVMQPTTKSSPIDHNFSLTMGNKKQWYKKGADSTLNNRKTIGYFAGASYNRSFSHFTNGYRGRYQLGAPIEEASTLTTNRDLVWEQSQDNVLLGSLINLKYVANKRNFIGLNFIHNNSGQSSVSKLSGFSDADPDVTFRVEQLGYLQRGMNSIQFYGEHKLVNPDSVKAKSRAKHFSGIVDAPYIDWIAAYTLAKQSEPDLRFISDQYTVDAGDTTFVIRNSNGNKPGRYFRTMDEYNLDHKFNVTIPIEIDSARILEIKTGVSNVSKIRQFNELRFDYASINESSYNGNFAESLADQYTGYQNTWLTGLINASTLRNNYRGVSSISAAYLKLKAPITNKLDFVGGFRDEHTYITVESEDQTLAKSELIRNDILPSINFNYSIIESQLKRDRIDTTVNNKRDLKLRVGYNKTLARPNFRELAPYATLDYALGFLLIGNSTLDRTLIDNFDLKLEFYPRKMETFSVATFYKKFTNPIELLAETKADGQFTWRTVPRADLFGAEFEFKKRLDIISPKLEDWRFGGNLTLVKSAIQINKEELKVIRATDTEHAETRPLFGQSPYLLNLFIDYAPDTANFSENFKTTKMAKVLNGTSVQLNYNTFGKRLVVVTTGGTPDVYEMPFHTLNFTLDKQINKRLSCSIKANNLLNSRVRQMYLFNSKKAIYDKFKEDYVFSNNRNGVSFSGSVTYRF